MESVGGEDECGGETSLRICFVSHPYRHEPEENAKRVVEIARRLVHDGYLPLAPQLFMPRFVNEAKERDLALRMCLQLVALCDELRVYGNVSEGMRLEIAEARRLGIPVVDGDTGRAWSAKREPPRRANARAAVER